MSKNSTNQMFYFVDSHTVGADLNVEIMRCFVCLIFIQMPFVHTCQHLFLQHMIANTVLSVFCGFKSRSLCSYGAAQTSALCRGLRHPLSTPM